ncbi:MAG: hypothetical protein QM648_09175 [Solirubrobacterales bacterium]
MEFVRKGLGKFHCGDFTIVRPSGWKVSRDAIELIRPGHDYNFRADGDQLWLLDDEREVGYAQGSTSRWRLVVADRHFVLAQPKLGVNHSLLNERDSLVSEVGGGGFPLKIVELNRPAGLTEEQQVFVVAVALLAWREADRSMMSRGGNSGIPAGP